MDINHSPRRNSAAIVLWGGALLTVFLLILRVIVVAPDLNGLGIFSSFAIFLGSSAEDIAFALTVVFAALVLLRSLPQATHFIVETTFSVLAAVTAAIGLLNLIALGMLNAPLTMDWVRYSDIAHTDVVLDSLFHLLPIDMLLGGLAAVSGLYLLARFAAKKESITYLPKLAITLAAMAMLGGFVLAGRASPVPEGKQRNPILAFTQSLFSDGGQASLDRLVDTTTFGLVQDWPFDRVAGVERPKAPQKPLRNVILFAYESTPAKQSEGWGGTMPVTPNLRASLSNALAFDNAYAHVPASNYFLVSAFASLIPELSAVSTTYTHPEFDFNALPKVLNGAGFRTGFFNSSDNRFQNTEVFTRAAGFETVKDYRDWTCETGIYEYTSVSEKFLNTSSDLCTVDKIMDWIEEDPTTPFFMAFRTGMTHYPYFPGENPIDFGVKDENYNNYLNALKVGDEAFGKLLAYIDQKGMSDETLILVMGDHGEAFGEHGTYVHAAGINEENVHVPFALINPQLFDGARSDLIVGLKDVGPTITDLLGIDAPATWQGESVFAQSRSNGVMLFAPWNGFLVGYRQGSTKVIYNANSDELAVYSLTEDPEERTNLVLTHPELGKPAKETLSAMISVQRTYFDALLSGEQPLIKKDGLFESITIAASGTYVGEPPKVWVKVDGKDIGGFTVSSAISNENRNVPEEEIHAVLEKFVLPLEVGLECPKRLEIYFLNDNWAGEGKTGDTDLWVRSVEIGGSTYHTTSFRELKDNVGHNSGDYYRFSRNGGAYIDLYLDENCLAASLETDSANAETETAGQ